MKGYTIDLYHAQSIDTKGLDTLLLLLKCIPAELIHCVAIWDDNKVWQMTVCSQILEICTPNMIFIGPNQHFPVERLLQSKGYNMPGGNWVLATQKTSDAGTIKKSA